MGGVATLTLGGDPAVAEAAARVAQAEVTRIEAKYSRYLPDSVMAEINRIAAEGDRLEVDDETAELLDFAFACFESSDGLFDVSSGLLRRAWNFHSDAPPSQQVLEPLLERVGLDKVLWDRPVLSFRVSGMELDFGGIGKEYAVDRCVDVCRELGVRSGMIDLSGDIGAMGPQPDGSPWRIAVQHPLRPDESITAVSLSDGAVATSGDYARGMTVNGRRYGHLLNPKTGWPVEGLVSVTVLAPRCLAAGAVASIGMLKGAAGAEWLAKTGLRCGWVTHSGVGAGDLFAAD